MARFMRLVSEDVRGILVIVDVVMEEKVSKEVDLKSSISR